MATWGRWCHGQTSERAPRDRSQVRRKLRNIRVRTSRLTADGRVPSELIPAVVADPRLCARCMIGSVSKLPAIRDHLSSLADLLAAEFHEDPQVGAMVP